MIVSHRRDFALTDGMGQTEGMGDRHVRCEVASLALRRGERETPRAGFEVLVMFGICLVNFKSS